MKSINMHDETFGDWIIAFFNDVFVNNSIIVQNMILKCYANIFVPISYIKSFILLFLFC